MFQKRKILILIIIFLILFSISSYSQTITRVNTIRINMFGVLDDKGDMNLNVKFTFPTNAMYIQIKTAYPNPYVIVRNLLGSSSTMEFRDAKVSYEDQSNSLRLIAKVLGAAVNKRQRWNVNIGKNTEMLYSDSQKALFLSVQPAFEDNVMIQTFTLNLPKGATDFKFDPKTGIFTYLLNRNPAKGKTNVDVNFKYKPRIMSALYKVYGNPELLNGQYWIAKTIFTNTGTSDIVELRISYKLGDYSSWSPESIYSLVAPGGTIVDFYYPIISPNIAQLKTASFADLQIKYSYKDINGKTYSDSVSYRIQILGINQFEFSNLPEEERTGVWIDDFANVPLLSAFVTKLDDPVKMFAGMVSQYAGGPATASNDKEAIKFCNALYDLMVFNGISYQTPSGFLVEYKSGGQDIKYPRDVLRDKAGTCIDLAIFYASVCETVGLKTYIVVIPGHAFPVIELPSGDILPIEATGVGGSAVGKSATFEEVVEIGEKNLQELKIGKFFIVDVQKLQSDGVLPPELPKLSEDILTKWGYKVPTEETKPIQSSGQTTQTQINTQETRIQPTSVNISGRYEGMYKNLATGATGELALTLYQNGLNISGEIEVDYSTGTISGTISGSNIQFNAIIEDYYGQKIVVNFTGVIQGNTISGNYIIKGANVNGTFNVKKVQ